MIVIGILKLIFKQWIELIESDKRNKSTSIDSSRKTRSKKKSLNEQHRNYVLINSLFNKVAHNKLLVKQLLKMSYSQWFNMVQKRFLKQRVERSVKMILMKFSVVETKEQKNSKKDTPNLELMSFKISHLNLRIIGWEKISNKRSILD